MTGTFLPTTVLPMTVPLAAPRGTATKQSRWAGLCPKAESFPSKGGADCPDKCHPGTRSFYTHFWLGKPETDKLPFRGLRRPGYNLTRWQEQMQSAAKIMRKHGKVEATGGMSTDWGRSSEFHMSFNYFCCYSNFEWHQLLSALQRAPVWDEVHEAKWSSVVCRIDGPAEDHISFILLADDETNVQLQEWIASIEAFVESESGVPIHVPRSRQQPFHVTLGVVDGSSLYPIDIALYVDMQ